MEYASIERFIKDYNNGRISDKVFNNLITKQNYNLPSGNYGNIIAYALELHCYRVVNYIVRNNDIYGFDLNEIAYDKKGSLSIIDVLKKSIKTRVKDKDIEKYKDMKETYNKLKREYLLNEADLLLLCSRLELNMDVKMNTSIKI